LNIKRLSPNTVTGVCNLAQEELRRDRWSRWPVFIPRPGFAAAGNDVWSTTPGNTHSVRAFAFLTLWILV